MILNNTTFSAVAKAGREDDLNRFKDETNALQQQTDGLIEEFNKKMTRLKEQHVADRNKGMLLNS